MNVVNRILLESVWIGIFIPHQNSIDVCRIWPFLFRFFKSTEQFFIGRILIKDAIVIQKSEECHSIYQLTAKVFLNDKYSLELKVKSIECLYNSSFWYIKKCEQTMRYDTNF